MSICFLSFVHSLQRKLLNPSIVRAIAWWNTIPVKRKIIYLKWPNSFRSKWRNLKWLYMYVWWLQWIMQMIFKGKSFSFFLFIPFERSNVTEHIAMWSWTMRNGNVTKHHEWEHFIVTKDVQHIDWKRYWMQFYVFFSVTRWKMKDFFFLFCFFMKNNKLGWLEWTEWV